MRPKYIVTYKDILIFIEYLWTSDDHHFLHDRHWVDLCYEFCVFGSSGARAGGMVESSSYRGTNEAVTYRVRHIPSIFSC